MTEESEKRIVEMLSQMNDYLDGIDMYDLLQYNRKMFHFPVIFTREQYEQDVLVLDLSARANNCLKRAGVHTIGHLVEGFYTKEDASSKRQLLRLRMLGSGTAEEILLKLFCYQFMVLPDEKKRSYMRRVVEANSWGARD